MFGFDCEYTVVDPKIKFFDQKLPKISSKKFYPKTYFA